MPESLQWHSLWRRYDRERYSADDAMGDHLERMQPESAPYLHTFRGYEYAPALAVAFTGHGVAVDDAIKLDELVDTVAAYFGMSTSD